MVKSYFKIAWRNLFKNKTSSFINISGLAVGMAVAMLIGLWVLDELSFDKNFKNYDHIAQVMQHQTANGNVNTFSYTPFPLAKELQSNFSSDFKHIVMASYRRDHILTYGEQKLSEEGIFMDVEAPEMLTLHMLEGSGNGLKDPGSILLSSATAKAIFGNKDALDNLVKIDNKLDVKVTGVFEDFPGNNSFQNISFIAPWNLYKTSEQWIIDADKENRWDNNSFQTFVQIADNTNFETVNKKIIDCKQSHVDPEDKKYQTKIFLNPMQDWHLRSHWDNNGIKEGGAIEYVRLFTIIGIFILLLACINFMNLSTARSEKRAKEVGIRKTIGSLRSQIIGQFYCESLLVVVCAFMLSVLLGQVALPLFNEIDGKNISIPYSNPVFWFTGICFTIITGMFAGSYPALYLSSFDPIKVLKGTFRAGQFASLPRKVLVVLQFTISIALVIGTIVIYKQVQYSRNRPIGYDRNGLMMIQMKSPDFYGKFGLLENELKNSGAIKEFAESSSPVTDVSSTNDGFTWPGKDPNLAVDFGSIWVTHDFGKTVGWQFKEGRDFSKDFTTDSSAIVINEAAVKFMGLKNPIGTQVAWDGKNYKVIGVIKDMLMESPFDPVKQTIYFLDYNNVNWILLKLSPNESASSSVLKIASVFKKYIPSAPFDYKFADTEFAAKFAAEEQVGKLSAFFATLAIFICCLGLFGMASFMAEQRTKEIGVRKVLGASVFNVWQLLSKEFIILVIISLTIAIPIAFYFMHSWLQNYQYRTNISWWIFVVAGLAALVITLLTVSFQAIKAAVANPVKSLRTE
jgi:putative ABC transport system permease protein